MAAFKEHPLPLITLQNGVFQLGAEALNVISSIKEEVAIVAVAGLYRTGKSFVLNRLLDRQDGFDVGPTTNPCTKGIYTWGKPIHITKDNGKKLAIILIDTEGIGSTQQDASYDAKIFSLAVLLSSFFIYNSVGTIDERALENLSLIANLSKTITEKENKKTGGDPETIAEYFPSFLWLVRDFALKLKDEQDNDITSKDYLEAALKEKPGEKQKEKNDIRRAIKQFFHTRDCITLVRPVTDEDALQTIDKIKFTDLRPEFRNQVTHLKKKVFAEVAPKRVMGHTINGRALVNLVKSYVEAINTGGVPAIHTAFHAVALIENQQAFETAVAHYHNLAKASLDGKYPLDDSALSNAHNNACNSAIETFKSHTIGDDITALLTKLHHFFAEELNKHQERNLAATKVHAAQLINELVQPLHEQMRAGKFKSVEELMSSWANMQTQYSKKARGTVHAIVEALNSAVPNHLHKLVVQFTTLIQNQHQAKLDEQRKKEDDLNKQIMTARKEVEAEKEKAHKHEVELTRSAERVKQQEKDIKNLQSDKDQLTQERNKLKQDLSSREADLKAKELSLASETAARKSLEKELELATKSAAALESDVSKLNASLTKAETKAETAEKERSKLETKVGILEEKLNSQKDIFEGSVKSFKEKISALEAEISSLRTQRDELSKNMDSSSKRLQASLDQEVKKHAEVVKTAKSLEERVNELVKEVAEISAERDAALQRHSSSQKKDNDEIAKLKKDIQQQSHELAKMKQETQSLEEREKAIRQERDGLKKEHTEAKKEASDLQRTIQDLTKKLDAAASARAAVESEIKTAKQENADLAKRLIAAEAAAEIASKKAVVAAVSSSTSSKKTAAAPKPEELSSEDNDDDTNGAAEEEEPTKPAKKAAARGRAKATASAKAKGKAPVDESSSEDEAPKPARGKRKRADDDDEDKAQEAPAKRAKIDPNSLTKPQLKSELTKLGVKLPPKDQPKNVYVELYEKHVN